MDTLISKSPLATVQLIPVFNYLNLLSDFLFTEYKLDSYNQYKQIPIVNSLYEYLEDHHDNITMHTKLIQNLLKGSDLYGEKDHENVDEIFVNTMFDYIISSLVFDKYGNIYGFLADTIRKVENLQLDNVLKVIKETLKNATFDNEYGPNSVLTELAVNRIYTDIILPIFPKPKTNLSILSLDYIFAQAGSTYLRLGSINDTYYSDFENNNNIKYFNENLFDEYLITGHIIRNLLHYKKIDILVLRVFALPALLYYSTTEDKVKHESITNIIFNPDHWMTAYDKFLIYLHNAYNQIEDQLKNDYTYKIHLEFSNFQNRASMAKSIIDLNCSFFSDKTFPNSQVSEHYKCSPVVALPNINKWYNDQVYSLSEIYGNYDLQITLKCLKESLVGDFDDVVIKLVVTNSELVNTNFTTFQYLSYDLLEFYYTNYNTSDYYALLRNDYTVTLINELDNPELFQRQIGPSFQRFKRFANRIILKSGNEGITELSEKLMKYKKERFKSYLTLFNYSLKNNEWWKEFGLSLVPFYPCLSKLVNYNNNQENLCEKDIIKFLNKFPDMLTRITNVNTRSLLSVFGTNLKTILLNDVIIKTIDTLVVSYNVSYLSTQNELDIKAYSNQVSLHVEEPTFETMSISKEGIQLVKKIFSNLKEKISYNFTFVNYVLHRMVYLQNIILKEIGHVDENKFRKLFVYSVNYNTGYGYKFINIYNTTTATLRTEYESKEKIFSTLLLDLPENRKTHIKINNASFEFEPNDYLFEIYNQLRKKSTILLLSGIWNHHDNENCMDYQQLELTKHSNDCLRHWRFMEKIRQLEVAVDKLRNNIIIDGGLVATDVEIRNELKKYTFPDDSVFLFYFVSEWKKNKKFEQSDWSRSCIIENSDLLNELRFDLYLEKNNITITNGLDRINVIYTYRERLKIEDGTTIENIIRNFNDQKAGFSVTFEDYYALRNFVTSGYTRISGDTPEAKRMKLALYKLAIRQSDDLREEFEWTLFRLESKSIDIVDIDFSLGKQVILQKFTITSTNIAAAIRFAASEANGFRNILYEIKFFNHYFRIAIKTEVDKLESSNEKNIILLPGTEFEIYDILTLSIDGIGEVLKVILHVANDNIGKHQRYKNIMRKITELKV
ncbi:uncharacterized protein LOC127288360 [Leptopilina boulardi]|uniref:uncharacterized protein LOC127288360 n=1 Tax=Leptopilina boulardi TaxID=63433 RepID=UPI0021F60B46|nr:uncharacterized protein LOC127288360 [Leptopilina boulardi]